MERPTCGAKRRDGQLCQNAPIRGGTRCRFHGGKSLKGMASPNWRHGKYSSVLPARLGKIVAKLVDDRELLSLREDIALTTARIQEQLKEWESIEADSARKLMRIADETESLLAGEYDDADLEERLLSFISLTRAMNTRLSRSRDFERTQEHLRRLIETETKRQQLLQHYLPAEDAHQLFNTLTLIVKNHVKDRQVLMAIGNDISRLIELPAAEREVQLPAISAGEGENEHDGS